MRGGREDAWGAVQGPEGWGVRTEVGWAVDGGGVL